MDPNTWKELVRFNSPVAIIKAKTFVQQQLLSETLVEDIVDPMTDAIQLKWAVKALSAAYSEPILTTQVRELTEKMLKNVHVRLEQAQSDVQG